MEALVTADAPTLTLTATEFKAKCLGILDRLAARELSAVSVTKRGKVVAVLTPPRPAPEESVPAIHGFLRGSVRLPEGFDPTEPFLEEMPLAALGVIHS